MLLCQMADITMEKQKAGKVQPTYVLISPYAFQTNEFIEFVAKIGPPFFITIFSFCMFLFYSLTRDYFWVLFMPQFLFFSLTFIISCISNNKTFQLVQIVVTYILFDYSFYLACLITANFNPNNKICFCMFGLLATHILYAIALQIVHRQRYVKDLSTSESISTLNKIDFYQVLLFIASIFLAIPIFLYLGFVFSFWIYNVDGKSNLPSQSTLNFLRIVFDIAGKFSVCCLVLLTCVLRFKHSNVNYWNSTKALTSSKDVVIDCDGRAWYCLLWSSRTVGKPKKLSGSNMSSVEPEESQKFEKVQPTNALISPYAFQTNNFIERVAKFGPLFFAAIFFTCMILFHLKTNNNFWILFMPQFVFFSLTFIIGCVSNNKTIKLVQIVITYISIAYSYYLACLTGAMRYDTVIFISHLFILTALFLHAIALQIVRKKHYVKDLSTPESVSSLDTAEFYYLLFFIVGMTFAEAVFQHLSSLSSFRIDTHDSDFDKLFIEPMSFTAIITILSYDLAEKLQLGSLVWFTCIFQFCYNNVDNGNSTTVSKPKKSTGWNHSSVKPEESQILPPFAEVNM